jgi:hypothetical protein
MNEQNNQWCTFKFTRGERGSKKIMHLSKILFHISFLEPYSKMVVK